MWCGTRQVGQSSHLYRKLIMALLSMNLSQQWFLNEEISSLLNTQYWIYAEMACFGVMKVNNHNLNFKKGLSRPFTDNFNGIPVGHSLKLINPHFQVNLYPQNSNNSVNKFSIFNGNAIEKSTTMAIVLSKGSAT